MGSKTKTKTVHDDVQTNAPPSWALPTMQDLASHIQAGAQAVQNVPAYTGDFVAQPGPLQLGVPQAYLDAAHLASSLIPQAQNAVNLSTQMPTFEGPSLTGATTSYADAHPGGMTAAVNAAINPVLRNLTEQILPSLQSSGIDSGAYGGSRAQVTLPAQALHDFDTEAGNIAANLSYQDYGDTANRVLQAYQDATTRGLGTAQTLTDRLQITPDLLDAVMRMGGGAAELQNQAAGIDTQNRQSSIDNALQQYQYAIQRPFMGYDTATELISRLAGNYGTQTSHGTSTQTQSTGGLAPVLGAAMGLAGMVGGFPMAGGGSAGGSLVSSLFGRH